MGQYYTPTTIENGIATRWSLQPINWDGSASSYYNGNKLMEHSYSGNHIVNLISCYIYQHPVKIAWIGDYANPENGSAHEKFSEIESCITEENEKKYEYIMPISYSGLWLCNHTKKIGFDMSGFSFKTDRWTINPIPILTAVGNGLGGGDFHPDSEYPSSKLVGDWAFDTISLEFKLPEDFKEIGPVIFVES